MIGRVISGRYTVESLIGSGGMANVYKAHDNMLNRTVALKVLKEEHRGGHGVRAPLRARSARRAQPFA